MNTFTKLVTLLLLAVSTTCFANSQQGGQFETFKSWEVHYIAFPSTVLQPKIAQHYGLKRSSHSGVVNISILDKNSKKAQKVSISGIAKNLIGHKETLKFKEVVEGDAVYYIAPISYSNEEVYRFEISLKQNAIAETLKFQQKFYVD